MKLGLGTVQFGMEYGVTNRDGQVSSGEAGRILALAAGAGVRVLDTAPSYGDSEEVLGRLLPQDHHFQVVTKTPHFSRNLSADEVAEKLSDAFESSLERLRQKKVYGLLVHGPEDLLQPFGNGLFAEMKRLQRMGQVEKVGASVYNADQIDGILAAFDIDLIQLPLNVLDQRLIASGHLRKLKERGVEIHVRSVFLQGVLLAKPDSLPRHFDSIKDKLGQYHDMVGAHQMTPVQAALAFANNQEEVDVVLCGVTTREHLSQILEETTTPVSNDIFADFAIHDPAMLNPARWELT